MLLKRKPTALRLSFLLLSFFLATIMYAQSRPITGKVLGEDNKPLAGATVAVKGTNVATQTDEGGNFSISVPTGRNVLTVSSVGYQTHDFTLGNSGIVSISLTSTAAALSEIVVTGYSTQRKKDITGAVSVVDVANMKQIPTGTPEQALQGQASGVQIVTSGMPGTSSAIRVRGITSAGNINPLIIVDGTPGSLHDLNINDIESVQVLKDAGAAAIYGVRGSNGVIIVTTKRGRSGRAKVAYDAYYGTQRPLKNGFNIANTAETAQAYYQSYFNSGTAFSTNKQFGRGATNGPVIPVYITPTAGQPGDPGTDPSTYSLYSNQITLANQQGTDWFHEIFKPAPIQSHSISVSSGGEKSSYYFSLGYFNQQGTLIETYLKRYSARLNTVFAIGANNHIRVGENGYVFYRQNPGITNQNEGNAISMSYRESPIIPIYDIKGNYAGTLSKGLGNAQNPVANMRRTHNNKGNDWQIQGNVFAEADIIKNLVARTQFGGTIDNYYNAFFSYTSYENGENNQNPNSFTEQFGYNSSWTWTNTLRYNYNLSKHTINALIGSEAINNYGRAIQGNRSGYYITNPGNLTVDPNLWTLSFGPPTGQTTANINGTPYQNSLYSLFGRVDYNFADKYLLAGTIRRDGSSLFAPGHRIGWFPSVSAGWRISREAFMQNVTWINDLKIRGGWGKLGSNVNVGSNNAYDLYGQSASRSYYDIAGANNSATFGIYPQQIGNANTTWEQDIITNVGFDATLFQNKFDLSIEWYKKAISGLLFTPLAYTGANYASQPAVNAGNIENKGIDASLTYHGTIHRDLSFDITGTFTSYNNKVVSLPPGIKYYDVNNSGSSRIGNFTRLQPGEPVGEFFGYQVIGFFQSAEDVQKSPTQPGAGPGLLKFADINGDGKIDANDRTFIGNPNPKFTSGLNIDLRYKNFDFSTFLYASVGNKDFNYVRYWTDFPQVFEGAVSKDAVYNSVKLVDQQGNPAPFQIPDPANPGSFILNPNAHVANPNARVPILIRSANFSNTLNVSSYYIENGSYLRMKSLILGYTLPGKLLSRYKIDRLRIYVQAANLFTVTKYTGLDPELMNSNLTDQRGGFGIDLGNYPSNQKSYNIGINLGF